MFYVGRAGCGAVMKYYYRCYAWVILEQYLLFQCTSPSLYKETICLVGNTTMMTRLADCTVLT